MKQLDVASMQLIEEWRSIGVTAHLRATVPLHGERGRPEPAIAFIELGSGETIQPASQPHDEVLLVLGGNVQLEVTNWCAWGRRGTAVLVPATEPRRIHNPGPETAYLASILPEPAIVAAFIAPLRPLDVHGLPREAVGPSAAD